MANLISLNEAKVKSKVKVVEISQNSRMRKRIMDMGIVKGTNIVIEGKAPMGDPIEILVRGYNLTLRNDEAKDIKVELI
ncbi:iron transporter FeoA [Clostridium carboxidivorans P7]|uniref:FeoA family protein n=1 Tax=Clostridium carboxidivorans P7 TaxID=536227 RepID=C6PWX6_9CLOT|nr:FeoA domain-containing protein [Clostridium carboxidivorans]AKN32159.1 iron transporter FeoA [Clostridium carboxidivorans P7]EET86282.1 FeoA family protein [Clostridium carboxidivorans P7]